MKLEIQVKQEDIGKSINTLLQGKYKISTRLLKKLIATKNIQTNNTFQNTNTLLNEHDLITIDFSYPEDNSGIPAYDFPLDILYEDDFLLIVNKPPHIPVHPSSSCFDKSLSNMVKAYFDSIHLKKIIRPVNRLDLDTTGIVIFAKCEYIQECLKDMIYNKEYLCFCEGNFNQTHFTVDKPIGRKAGSIIEREVNEQGKVATTDFEVISSYPNYSLLKCSLHTGRTHQIRVHLSYILHPIIGDTLYGTCSNKIKRQALHSSYIHFNHPITNEKTQIISPIPKDMKNLQTL